MLYSTIVRAQEPRKTDLDVVMGLPQSSAFGVGLDVGLRLGLGTGFEMDLARLQLCLVLLQ